MKILLIVLKGQRLAPTEDCCIAAACSSPVIIFTKTTIDMSRAGANETIHEFVTIDIRRTRRNSRPEVQRSNPDERQMIMFKHGLLRLSICERILFDGPDFCIRPLSECSREPSGSVLQESQTNMNAAILKPPAPNKDPMLTAHFVWTTLQPARPDSCKLHDVEH